MVAYGRRRKREGGEMSMMRTVILALVGAMVLVTQVFAGDWTGHDFLYKPALGARGAQEKGNFDSGQDRVDARLGKEIWVGDPKYGTTLQDAITAIGSTNAILRVPAGAYATSANLTIPVNVTLRVERGANLAIATGQTLTINGGLEAGLYQIFSCAGTGKVVFGAGKVKELYPHWWGYVSGTECGTALNTCLQAAKAVAAAGYPWSGYGGFTVKLPTGIYLTDSPIKVPPNVNLTGEGHANSVIKANSAAADPVVQFESSSSQAHSIISHLAVNGDNKVGVGISFTDGAQIQHNYATVANCYITRVTTGIKVDGLATASHYVIYGKIVDNQFESVTNGILLDNRINAFRIERNFIHATEYGIISNATAALDDVQIVGNTIDGPMEWAIKISGVWGTQAIAANITRNRIESAQGVNIATTYTSSLVHDNQIYCTGYAVQIHGFSCSVQGNQFGGGGSPTYAINIESGAQHTKIGWNNFGMASVGSVYPKRILNNGFFTVIDPHIIGNSYTAGETYERGDIYWNPAPSAGGSPGVVCTTGGTYGAVYSSTGAIDSGSVTLTVVSTTGLFRSQYITIAGVTGVKKVMKVNGSTTVTIDVAADATVGPAAAVVHSAPVFKAMANLAP
jgi:hypothetical protein